MIENFVVLELLKQCTWSRARVRIMHFRTVAGRGVDTVMEDPAGRVVGIEVKAGASIDSRDFNGLRTLAEACGAKFVRGVILYGGDEVVPFDNKMAAVPIHALWS